ncbi:hypothetical protein NMG60_11004053 [Bertholletia excelsa]
MAAAFDSSESPSPSPKSPPWHSDLYGKRRQMAKVLILEREIVMLEEELKSLEGLQVSSRCCEELGHFVEARADPLLATDEKTSRSHCCCKICCNSFWGKLGIKRSCCFGGCSIRPDAPICCTYCRQDKPRRPRSCCLGRCCPKCSHRLVPFCPRFTCFPRFAKLKLRPKCCTKTCHNPCTLCD